MITDPSDDRRPVTVVGPRRRLRRAAVGLALVGGLALSACGGTENSGGGGNTGDTSGGSKGTATGGEAPVTVGAAEKPRKGGTLKYALEAETDGFSPTRNRWAISGTDVALAIYDPIAAIDKDGAPKPYLAEKWEASDDNKTWKITMRSGITFHNGEKLDAKAVEATYLAQQKSFLTGSALVNMETVKATGELEVTFTMRDPWATFPSILTSQLGVVPAPEQLAMENGGPLNPIGTGPFKLKTRTPDKETVLERNEKYWRKDDDGVQLPYLDEIVFLPTADNNTRVKGLEAGNFDMMHTSDGPSIIQLRELADKGTIQKVEDQGESEEGFILLNLDKAPFDDLRVRKAMAMAIDTDAYTQNAGQGVNRPARGVFSENSPWYAANDYPTYDPAAATELVNQYEAEKGPITFVLRGGGEGIRPQLETVQAAFAAVGIDVTVETLEQTAFIVAALGGNFDANIWRQWGEVDPDQDYVWWAGENAKPIGESSLNIGRNKDPKVDEALLRGRSTTDVAERKKAYADVQKQFGENVPYIWLDHSTWMVAAGKNVRGITNGKLPDGSESIPIGGTTFPGTHRLVQTWLAA